MGTLLLVVIFMAIVLYLLSGLDSHRNRYRHDRLHPNQSEHYTDDFDEYRQPHYPQQYPVNAPPIIVMGGGYAQHPQYPSPDYRNNGRGMSMTALLFAMGLGVFGALYFSDKLAQGDKKEEKKAEKVTDGQQTSKDKRQNDTPRKKSPLPAPQKDYYVIILDQYSLRDGVEELKELTKRDDIFCIFANGLYWACISVNRNDAEQTMEYWGQHRKYGVEPELKNLRTHCLGLGQSIENDMYICDCIDQE